MRDEIEAQTTSYVVAVLLIIMQLFTVHEGMQIRRVDPSIHDLS